MKMDTQRSALMLYSLVDDKVFLLLGVNRKQLTTIGGRRQEKENEMDCLIREIREETKRVIDYTNCPDFLSIATMKRYNLCFYAFLETSHQNLQRICYEFSKATASDPESNELSSLEIINLDEFVEKAIVIGETSQHRIADGTSITARPELRRMILDIGFDVLRKKRTSKTESHLLPINYFSSQMSVKVELFCPVSEVPMIVSVSPFNRDLPHVYGIVLPSGCYISDQFFLDEPRRTLYRTGWVMKK